MADDRVRGDASPAAGAPHPPEPFLGDLAALFAHGPHEEPEAVADFDDDVGALFAPSAVTAGEGSAEPPADGLFAEPANATPSPRPGSTPRKIPAMHEPEHAAPGYGLTRSQRIAMGVGAVVTMLGAGWALAAPASSGPVGETPSPIATVDPARAAAVADGIDALAGALQSAEASAGSFAAPLAAMAGSSDETARAAAEAARQTYAAALAAVKVPAKTGATSGNAVLDEAERGTAAAQHALTAATTAFRAAISAFTQSLPAYAETAVATDADADESFRTAVTDAAATVAATDPLGPTAFTTWDAWRVALAALHEDQARAVAAQSSTDSGTTDSGTTDSGGTDSGGTDSGTTPTTPESTPTTEPQPTSPPVVVSPDPTVPPIG
ncbi:hypothetical protein [Microbacterium sp. 22242]|uniref:hypothetical protein n=1 Tax=Microbacterium sp. 22242 TaxID=3453896 RepID=UPI003F82FB0C